MSSPIAYDSEPARALQEVSEGCKGVTEPDMCFSPTGLVRDRECERVCEKDGMNGSCKQIKKVIVLALERTGNTFPFV